MFKKYRTIISTLILLFLVSACGLAAKTTPTSSTVPVPAMLPEATLTPLLATATSLPPTATPPPRTDMPAATGLVSLPVAASDTGATSTENIETYLGEKTPDSKPVVFRPGSVSTAAIELSVAVHPNLREIYFTRLEAGKATILVSRQSDQGWTNPEPTSFSGQYDDISPFISADGRALYFSSNRPAAGSAAPDEPYRLWFVERTGDGWSTPTRLKLPVESLGDEMSATLTRDGTLYYLANYPSLGGEGLYRSQFVNWEYQLPVKVNVLVNDEDIIEVEPFIAPGEDYLLFYSAGRSDNLTPDGRLGDIYISFRDSQGMWSAPQNLGMPVNSTAEESTPTLSPDGIYLFYASNRRAGNRFPDIYWAKADFLSALQVK